MLLQCDNLYYKPTHIRFLLICVRFWSVIAGKQHFVQLWGSKIVFLVCVHENQDATSCRAQSSFRIGKNSRV